MAMRGRASAHPASGHLPLFECAGSPGLYAADGAPSTAADAIAMGFADDYVPPESGDFSGNASSTTESTPRVARDAIEQPASNLLAQRHMTTS